MHFSIQILFRISVAIIALGLAGCGSTPLPPPPPTVTLFKKDAPRAIVELKSSTYANSRLALIGERYCAPTLWKPRMLAQEYTVAWAARSKKDVRAEIPAGKNIAFRAAQPSDPTHEIMVDFYMDVEPGTIYEVELERGSGLLMQWNFSVRIRKDGQLVPIQIINENPCDKFTGKNADA